MTFNRFNWSILWRVLLLFITLLACSFLLVKGEWLYAGTVFLIIIFQLVNFYRFHLKAQYEVEQFVESIHYRDFSRYFNVGKAPFELKSLRRGFNEINSTFKIISKEKETQYQYLQKILELVETGILSYQLDEEGSVVWMNDAFKKLLGIPYLKTIHSLEKRDKKIYNEIIELKNGQNKIVTVTKDQTSFKALVTSTAFQTDNKVYKLIAFQNVDEALDETEAQAWQKLLSVMTHEIMNSVAPISSLAGTLKKRLQSTIAHRQPNNDSQDDLELGLETIQRRSEGLLRFAETYRNLNKITKPYLQKIFVSDLFETLHQLMQPTLEQKNIESNIILRDPSLTLEIDTNLIEQVLINLILNAIEALKDKSDPRITLSAERADNNKIMIKISDNGCGMSPEIIEKIFIPFFSTKKNGSGIGLSLCKQIMLLHHGNIQVQSFPNEGTIFSLQF
jgi:nitrogen fixation/metabolism regulation signal transduction histidine kinase